MIFDVPAGSAETAPFYLAGNSRLDASKETPPTWRKSTWSMADGECVEVGNVADQVAVRDTKNINDQALVFSTDSWRSFLDKLNSHVS